MKTHRFLASFRAPIGGIPATIVHKSSAKVHGSFVAFLATQQHNLAARKAFIADMTGHRAAACAVLASAIWAWLRDECCPHEEEYKGDWIRSAARRNFGRGLASSWFN